MKIRAVKVFNQTKQTDVDLYAFGSDKPLTVTCSFEATAEAAGKKLNTRFYVVEEGKQCLLGTLAAEALGMVKFADEVVSI